MQNGPTLRFIDVINQLKAHSLIPSVRQFAQSIDTHPQCLSDIMRGKRNVSIDILENTKKLYPINLDYIFSGRGKAITKADNNQDKEVLLTVVTDTSGNERIVYVPQSAHAGYAGNSHDEEYFKELPSFSLPDDRYKHGSHRCFDVVGDSMEPSIFSGEKVICSFLEPEQWKFSLKTNHVYVLVLKTGIVVKRVINNILIDKTLTLISDNSYYDAQIIDVASVKEVWQVTTKISAFMTSPNHIRNGLHTEVDCLKDTITDQSRLIQSLNGTIEKLLKQNRKQFV